MSLNRQKQFTLKNGEWAGSTIALTSGYSGGMPCLVNSDGEIARAYSDTGYIGIYANGSAGQDADVSGDPVTFYTGNGIFTLEKAAAEAAYPFDETRSYTPGDNVGIVAGKWSNNSPSVVRARVLGAGAVTGGITPSLTLVFLQ